MNVTEYQSFKTDNKEETSWYFLGLGNGFNFSNTKLESLKQKKLYCLPEQKRLTEVELRGMVDTWITEQNITDILTIQIEPVLLSQLIKKYPCK